MLEAHPHPSRLSTDLEINMKSKQPVTSGRRPPSRARSRALSATEERLVPEAAKPLEILADPPSPAPSSALPSAPIETPKREISGEMRHLFARSCTSFAKGTADAGTKVMDAMSASANSAFDLTQDLAAAKSIPEAAAVYRRHARRQFETCSVHAQELSAIVQKIASDAMAPLTSGIPQIFKAIPVSS
jgi:phasin protein